MATAVGRGGLAPRHFPCADWLTARQAGPLDGQLRSTSRARRAAVIEAPARRSVSMVDASVASFRAATALRWEASISTPEYGDARRPYGTPTARGPSACAPGDVTCPASRPPPSASLRHCPGKSLSPRPEPAHRSSVRPARPSPATATPTPRSRASPKHGEGPPHPGSAHHSSRAPICSICTNCSEFSGHTRQVRTPLDNAVGPSVTGPVSNRETGGRPATTVGAPGRAAAFRGARGHPSRGVTSLTKTIPSWLARWAGSSGA